MPSWKPFLWTMNQTVLYNPHMPNRRVHFPNNGDFEDKIRKPRLAAERDGGEGWYNGGERWYKYTIYVDFNDRLFSIANSYHKSY